MVLDGEAGLFQLSGEVGGGVLFAGEGEGAAGRALAVAVFGRVVEDREELVVFAVLDRVEFVVVTLCATDGEAEKRGAKRAHAIHHRLDAKLLGVDAAFLVDLGVAVEAGGNFLVRGRAGQEITAELIDDKLIVGLVAIQRRDDPVAVFPNLAGRVDGVAVGIGVARDIEPRARPAFAVVGRVEQARDDALVSVGRLVVEKRVHFGRRRRQADQIETHAAKQRDAVGFGRGRNLLSLEAGENERVDGVARPIGEFHFRRIDARGRHEGPVNIFLGLLAGGCARSLSDPTLNKLNLRIAERRFFVGHPRNVVVRAGDDLQEDAFPGLRRIDRRAAVAALPQKFGSVHAQTALLLRSTVAAVAMLRENRLHLAHVIHGRS